MPSVLLLSNDDSLVQYVDLCLNQATQANVHVTCCQSIQESCERLQLNKDYDLIFLGHRIDQDGCKQELAKCLAPYIESKTTKICGTNKAFQDKEWARYYHQAETPTKLIGHILQELCLIREEGEEYLSVPFSSLSHYTHLPFNCYLKLQNEQNSKFVKVFRQGDYLEDSDIEKYLEKNIICFYLKASEVERIIEALYLEMLERANQDLVVLGECPGSEGVDYCQYLLRRIGVETAHGEAVKKAFSTFKEIVKNGKDKGHSIQELLSQKQGLFYKHSSMSALMALYLLEAAKWNLPEGPETLALASYFQNMYLIGDQEIRVRSDMELKNLPDSQRRIVVQNHARMTEVFLLENDVPNIELLRLVREQHGSNTGVGFGEAIASGSKLSSLFQLSSNFSLNLLDQNERDHELDMRQVLEKTKAIVTGREEKLYQSLEDIVLSMELSEV